MKHVIKLIILFFIVTSVTNSRVSAEKEAAKLGAPRQFPHHASIQRQRQHICSGSIVSSSWVLTSAYCTTFQIPTNLNIGVGANTPVGLTVYSVAKILVHPLYRETTKANDLSLVQTKSPIKFNEYTKPIALANRLVQSGNLQILMWYSSRLEYFDATVISLAECKSTALAVGLPNDDNICTINGPCVKDLGSALISPDDGLVGVTSWNIGTNCLDGHSSVYYHRNWILQNIQ